MTSIDRRALAWVARTVWFAVVLGTTPVHAGAVLFVDDDAPPAGDGASWDTAYRFLQDALARADAGDVSEIRVGQGAQLPDRDELTPDGTGNTTARFTLRPGVALRGGYAGVGAADPDARDVAQFQTILLGDLLGDDEPGFGNYADNSQVVVEAQNAGESVLDGFTVRASTEIGLAIEGGAVAIVACAFDVHAMSAVAEAGSTSSFESCTVTGNGDRAVTTTGDVALTDCRFASNLGSSTLSFRGSAEVTRCDFLDNENGTAVAAQDGHGTFTDCRFERNHSPGSGGAMWLGSFDAAVTLVRCVFDANTAFEHGGAIAAEKRENVLTATDCSFQNNAARFEGGGVSARRIEGVEMTRCAFEGNTGDYGGGVAAWGYAQVVLDACTFEGNTARTDGGGVRLFYGSRVEITDCLFAGNEASGDGGGLSSVFDTILETRGTRFEANEARQGGGVWSQRSSECLIEKCIFVGNRAFLGAGFAVQQRPVAIVDSTFVGNSAASGGGIASIESSPIIDRCRFLGNRATARGGGLFNWLAYDAVVTNSLFSGNTATEGGAIRDVGRYDAFINCTLAGNTAFFGGAISCFGNDDALMTNCVLWNNGDEPIDSDDGLTVRYSAVEGGHAGPGNMDDDPLFIDALGPDGIAGTLDDDLRLGRVSPAIDAGDGDALPSGITHDLDGNPRFVDDPETPDTGIGDPPFVDLGAYEHGIACMGDVDGDGDVGFSDVLTILATWGPCAGCPEDIDGDGEVGFAEVLIVLGAWGVCP